MLHLSTYIQVQHTQITNIFRLKTKLPAVMSSSVYIPTSMFVKTVLNEPTSLKNHFNCEMYISVQVLGLCRAGECARRPPSDHSLCLRTGRSPILANFSDARAASSLNSLLMSDERRPGTWHRACVAESTTNNNQQVSKQKHCFHGSIDETTVWKGFIYRAAQTKQIYLRLFAIKGHEDVQVGRLICYIRYALTFRVSYRFQVDSIFACLKFQPSY